MRCLVYEEGLKDPFVPVNEPEPMLKSCCSADWKEIGCAVAIAEGVPEGVEYAVAVSGWRKVVVRVEIGR